MTNGKTTQTCQIRVRSVHMKKTAAVTAGDQLKLKLYCGTNKGITWESSDPSTLSYQSDTGNRSVWAAKKAGTVAITATYRGNTYTTQVLVKPKNVPIYDIPEGADSTLPEI